MNQTRYLTNSSGNHIVQISPNASAQVNLVTRYIKDGLINGEAVIVIAKPALRRILKSKMDGISFDGKILQDQDQDQIKFFDAEFLLSNMVSDGVLEEAAFQEYVATPMNNSRYRKVRAFSEMADILWREDQYNMAIQLEVFWNNLSNTQEFSFLRTYSLDKLDPHTFEDALERICKCHSQLIPMEDDSTEQEMGETMLNVFGAAWSRVINKLADSQEIPRQIQSAPLTTLT